MASVRLSLERHINSGISLHPRRRLLKPRLVNNSLFPPLSSTVNLRLCMTMEKSWQSSWAVSTAIVLSSPVHF
jgi:hypothetical protein